MEEFHRSLLPLRSHSLPLSLSYDEFTLEMRQKLEVLLLLERNKCIVKPLLMKST